jgi:hypothetical protein
MIALCEVKYHLTHKMTNKLHNYPVKLHLMRFCHISFTKWQMRFIVIHYPLGEASQAYNLSFCESNDTSPRTSFTVCIRQVYRGDVLKTNYRIPQQILKLPANSWSYSTVIVINLTHFLSEWNIITISTVSMTKKIDSAVVQFHWTAEADFCKLSLTRFRGMFFGVIR